MPLSSIHDTHICFQNIEPYYSDGRKQKRNKKTNCSTDNFISHSLRSFIARWSPTHFTETEPEIITNVINIRGSFKRTADSAGLNESEEVCIGWRKFSVQVCFMASVVWIWWRRSLNRILMICQRFSMEFKSRDWADYFHFIHKSPFRLSQSIIFFEVW